MKENKERNKEIFKRYEAKERVKTIALRYSISITRVKQIVNKAYYRLKHKIK
jgi:Mor family transcriptional regulator